MSTTSTAGTGQRRNRTAGNRSSERYVLLGTQVPPEVKQHFKDAAARRGISLSRYFEMLAAVDPLADAPLDDEEPKEGDTKKP